MRCYALPCPLGQSKVLTMTQDPISKAQVGFSKWRAAVLAGVLLLLAAATLPAEEPSGAAVADFNSYIGRVEARLAKQHGSTGSFLAPEDQTRLQRGELIIEQLTPAAGAELPGALLHDWRGTAFVPGAKAADFDRLMRDFNAYPQHYSPQVLRVKVLAQQGYHYQVMMRVRQKHILTVVMDTEYDVAFFRDDFGKTGAQHEYSLSRSTKIAEIDSPGTAKERALSPSEEHGFLWRMNTYWSCEERDGGLTIQVESVTLTRSIPTGLGWAIGPFIESIPSESLEFTLRATRDALRR
ncbi:conserved exported hypothetical protein [Candidatus Sulfotelmatomonas gaucii]|uniref:Uncharacterized protein n=1 Tax=Candidatus Sulfuritelmatomonas gaucii TaxID=2043161 RepID=A0A2N9LA70_9BACT|nr:conserved exported hypothetical protein [Candidatus Sulfotelmatomonas gaucii]